MWLITTQGAYSAVEDKHDATGMTLVIRGRVHTDMKQLLEFLPQGTSIQTGGGTDYPYRVRCTREEWATAVARMALEVDYTNFKDAVKARQGKKRASAYMGIWSILNRLTPARVRQREDRRWASHRPAGERLFHEVFPWDADR